MGQRQKEICYTVGDPFKDSDGPALNPLIKVLPPPPIHPSAGYGVTDDKTMREVLSDDTVCAEPESKTGGCS